MAHFAEIGPDSIVLRVIVLRNEDCSAVDLWGKKLSEEFVGAGNCRLWFGGTWVQTSYNASFRKNFAGVGYTWDAARDAFIPPKPGDGWQLDELTCRWVAPGEAEQPRETNETNITAA